jgi:acetyltransferase
MFEVYEEHYKTDPLIPQISETRLYQTRKGRTFNIRHVRESDNQLLTDFMSRLSSSTLWMRFFLPYPKLSDEAIQREVGRLNQIFHSNGVVLVATSNVEGKEEIIAVGELIPDKKLLSTAELALTIRDDYQNEGIGSILGLRLVKEAAKKEVATLQAEAMTQNMKTLHMWSKLGLPYSFKTHEGITTMLAWLEC